MLAIRWRGLVSSFAVVLVSVAQVKMLHEGLAEAAPACETLPTNLAPRIPFTEEQIRRGLPEPGPFGVKDLRCCHVIARHRHTAFLELP